MKNFFRMLLGGILSLLGFGSCDVIGGGMVCMYGQPHADFTVKGTVTDEEGEPVEGIRAVVDAYFSWTDGAGNHYRELDYTDTLYTDSSGMVQRKTGLFDKSSDVTVTLTDVDGEKNGSFEEKVLEGLQMTQVKKGDDSWYNGAYELKFEATLKKKD